MSDGGRSGSDELPATPQGTVRWYHASTVTVRRAGVAPELLTEADVPRAAAGTLATPQVRGVSGALAAYRAAMALGAEATAAA